MEGWYMKKLSVHQLQDYIFDLSKCDEGYIELSTARIYCFKTLIKEVISRIMAIGYYPLTIQEPTDKQQIISFLNYSARFICFKLHPPIRGPCALSFDFYINSGGYWNNGYFLFGTPAQFRRD